MGRRATDTGATQAIAKPIARSLLFRDPLFTDSPFTDFPPVTVRKTTFDARLYHIPFRRWFLVVRVQRSGERQATKSDGLPHEDVIRRSRAATKSPATRTPALPIRRTAGKSGSTSGLSKVLRFTNA